jgi:hypothetical protein
VCGVRLQRGYARCGRGEVSLVLHVPADAEVRVQAVRGDVQVRGVRGPLSVDTMVGDVRVVDAGPDVSVSTESGEALVDRAPGVGLASLVRGPARLFLRALSALTALL